MRQDSGYCYFLKQKYSVLFKIRKTSYATVDLSYVHIHDVRLAMSPGNGFKSLLIDSNSDVTVTKRSKVIAVLHVDVTLCFIASVKLLLVGTNIIHTINLKYLRTILNSFRQVVVSKLYNRPLPVEKRKQTLVSQVNFLSPQIRYLNYFVKEKQHVGYNKINFFLS